MAQTARRPNAFVRGLRGTRQAARCPHHASGAGQGVEQAGQAQPQQLPIQMQANHRHGLPKQQRWFGVAHVAQVRHQRQPCAALLRLQPCFESNVRVHQLVAVARNVLATQIKRIHQHSQQQQQATHAFVAGAQFSHGHDARLRLERPPIVGKVIHHTGHNNGHHIRAQVMPMRGQPQGQHILHTCAQPRGQAIAHKLAHGAAGVGQQAVTPGPTAVPKKVVHRRQKNGHSQ